MRSHIVQKHASEFHQKAVDFYEKHITIETKPAVVKHTVKSILSPDYTPPQEGVNLCSMCNTCYRSFGKVTISYSVGPITLQHGDQIETSTSATQVLAF